MAVQPYSPTIEGVGTALSGRLQVRRHMLQRYLVAYLFILPVLLLYVIFVLRPTVQTFWLAFYKWNGVSDRSRVGRASEFSAAAGRSDLLAGAATQPDLDGRRRGVQSRRWPDCGSAPGQQHPRSPRLPARIFSPGRAGLGRHRHDLALDLRPDRLVKHLVGDPRTGVPDPRLARRFRCRASRAGHRVGLDDVRSQRGHPAGRDAGNRPHVSTTRPASTAPDTRRCSSTSPSLAAQHDHHRDPAGPGRCFQGLRHHLGHDPGRSHPLHRSPGNVLVQRGFQQNQYGYGSAIAVALALIILVSSILQSDNPGARR